MTGSALQNIEQIESSLWEAADQLRANSKVTSSENAMTVFGVPLDGNANFAWVQHIVRFGVSSSTSGARIARRLGVA
jgi:hypothetical protein